MELFTKLKINLSQNQQVQVDNEEPFRILIELRPDMAPKVSFRNFLSKYFSNIQGVSKKRYFCDFLSYFSSRGWILVFHMCFGIRILSPFHLAIQKVSIQNLNCPKNACADMIFIPALQSED